MIRTGLDRLLDEVEALAGRRYGLLSHAASVSMDLLPIHLALARAGADLPQRMFGPEHGFFGVEQDMVASADEVDPWLRIPIVSLYGDSAASLRPDGESFADLDLVVVDFQDVGSRYYTYAATAIWAAEVALEAGCEVWLLDRPNPLGGATIEGNVREPGLESFIGAFETPVRHGLTLGELARWALEGDRSSDGALKVWQMRGWTREMRWRETGRRWIAPSPNIPTPRIAGIYPGGCLLEGTNVSEGRGTTRPFELFGSPSIDPVKLADRLNSLSLAGARFVPTFFRPQFHKHGAEICGGVQWVAEDSRVMAPFRCGVEIVRALAEVDPGFDWREEPYEFVSDRPAIDLLAGSAALRLSVDNGATADAWVEGWRGEEEGFIGATEPFLLYPGDRVAAGRR